MDGLVDLLPTVSVVQYLSWWWIIWPIQNDAKTLENELNFDTWLPI